ncbi:MAG: ABC transporter permease [Acidobacteriota bacterium]
MLNDLRYALRWLRSSPGFGAVAVLSMGLGIGVNTTMFSIVDAVLLRPIPVADPGSLADVFTTGGDGDEYATTSYPDFLDLKAQNSVFSDMTAYTPMFAPLNLGDRARLVLGHLVTSNHFDFLGVRPLMGRALQPADDSPGAQPVVVIAHRLWQSDFGSDPSVIGRTIQLRGRAYTIVGVAPRDFTGVIPLIVPELWLPISQTEEVQPAGINDVVPSPTGKTRLERRGSRWLFVKGRLKPGQSPEQAHANVSLIGTQLEQAYPETNSRRRISAIATKDVRFLVPQASAPISIASAAVMAVVGLVLLIACANVAGMLLARASARTREICVRLAVGATRAHLIRQMLAEGIVLGLSGAVVAGALAAVLIRLLTTYQLPLPGSLPLDVRLDVRVILFAVGVALVAGILAALTPALKASAPDLVTALRGDRPIRQAAGRRWALRDLLVVGQLAATAVLLVVAGLLLRTLGAASSADVGFRTSGLALVSTDTTLVRYTPERGEQFWHDALARIRALPGVESAALASPRLPFDVNFNQTRIRIDGKAYQPDEQGEVVGNVSVAPGYFATLGIAFAEGRDFDAGDRRDTPLVAIINDTMAHRFWPDGSALGRTFTQAFGTNRYRVVGIVRDHRVYGVNERPAPYFHLAASQRPAAYNYIVARTPGDPAVLLDMMRRELRTMETGLVFVTSSTMEEAVATTLLPQRAGAALAAAFGLLGTVLAAIGLYGVIAFTVARRTREIGIRIAVGADTRSVLTLLLQQGFTIVLIGAGLGVVLALVAANLLRGALYGVGILDPVAWGAALAVLLAASIAAHVVPARRAMSVDPIVALRTE